MIILIFKTSVSCLAEISALKGELDKLGRWSFDLEDEDNILRIETPMTARDICTSLGLLGVRCTLLPY